MNVEHDQWWSRATALQATHSLFDHLGARDLGDHEFEIWLTVRDETNTPFTIRTRITSEQPLPSLRDIWPGAAWCEREASEGYALMVGVTDRLLLSEEEDRGVLRHDRLLPARQQPWPGSHEPSGKSRMTALGRA